MVNFFEKYFFDLITAINIILLICKNATIWIWIYIFNSVLEKNDN